MLFSPRSPSSTIQIFSSDEYFRRARRRISRTAFSVGSFDAIDFCPICVPFGHYDGPEIFRYEYPSICPMGADVRQSVLNFTALCYSCPIHPNFGADVTDQKRPHRIVVFEPDAGGHQASHMRYLVGYLIAEEPNIEVIFALSQDLIALLPTETAEALEDPSRLYCTLLALPDRDLPPLRTSNLVLRGLYRWFYLKRLARSVDARHAHFHYFDHALLGAALPFQGDGLFTYSGLLFRPSVHYAIINDSTTNNKERWRDRQKGWLYNRMLSNPRLTSVFTFDAYFAEYAKINLPHPEKVIGVPDPVPIELKELIAEAPSPNGDKVHFLLFGALSERKGVLAILDALARLDPKIAASCHIRFAGKIEPTIREEFNARLAQLTLDANPTHVEVLDRYLDENEVSAMVRAADVILAPYLRHVGSSGVLYWAAAAGKPVITQDYGLIGREAQEFGLGLIANTLSTASLADALATAIRANGDNLANPEGQARFIDGHSPQSFAAVLIKGMMQNEYRASSPPEPGVRGADHKAKSRLGGSV